MFKISTTMVLTYYSCTVMSCVLTGQASEIFNVDTQFNVNTLVLETPFENMIENTKLFTCDKE